MRTLPSPSSLPSLAPLQGGFPLATGRIGEHSTTLDPYDLADPSTLFPDLGKNHAEYRRWSLFGRRLGGTVSRKKSPPDPEAAEIRRLRKLRADALNAEKLGKSRSRELYPKSGIRYTPTMTEEEVSAIFANPANPDDIRTILRTPDTLSVFARIVRGAMKRVCRQRGIVLADDVGDLFGSIWDAAWRYLDRVASGKSNPPSPTRPNNRLLFTMVCYHITSHKILRHMKGWTSYKDIERGSSLFRVTFQFREPHPEDTRRFEAKIDRVLDSRPTGDVWGLFAKAVAEEFGVHSTPLKVVQTMIGQVLKNEDCGPSAIAEILSVSQPTVSEALAKIRKNLPQWAAVAASEI